MSPVNQIKPAFEKVSPEFGKSILVRNHDNIRPNRKASWHFHPEIELVYVDKGKGKRHIGNNLSYFQNSMLVIIGSNLPHHGFTDRLSEDGSETLIQFLPDLFGKEFMTLPELEGVRKLLERAKKGIVFGRKTKDRLGNKIQNLDSKKGLDQLMELLIILNHLGKTKDYQLLNIDGYAFEATPQDSQRIDKIFDYINSNFQTVIRLEEMANEVSMTVPAFCRYFKKVTGKTFTKMVNEFRVVHATKLLAESDMSITDICFECGFNNFSHFNKQFKIVTGENASKYRNQQQLLIH